MLSYSIAEKSFWKCQT